MFNETSYNTLSDVAIPLWQSLGYPSKAAWKQAGSPSGSTFTPPSGLPTVPQCPAGQVWYVGVSGGGACAAPSGVLGTGGGTSASNPLQALWQQLGFGSKQAWKQAGRPTGTSGGTVAGGDPTLVGGGGTGIDPTTGAPATSSSLGDMLASIPTTYWLIGGAIVLLMVLKK